MKFYEKLIACLLVMVMVFGFAVTRASAEDYTYKIRIYPGNAGSASTGEYLEMDGIALGTRVTISLPSSYQISFGGGTIDVGEDEKYYIRGVRVSGQDALSPLSFEVTKDMDFVVSYGMASNIVEYTVSFVDAETGEELAPSITYYGSLGDKPVASYQYIEGYQPDYYNITGTLKESGNAWVFHYTQVQEEQPTEESTEESTEAPTGEEETTTAEGETTTAEGETTTAEGETTTAATTTAEAETTTAEGETTTAEGETTTEEATTQPGEETTAEPESSGEGETTAPEETTPAETEPESTEPAEIIDIDDETIPQADIDDGSSERGLIPGFLNLPLGAQIGIIAGGVVVLGGLIWLILLGVRKRKKS